jgi:lipid-binding SYLF domain-containing protein
MLMISRKLIASGALVLATLLAGCNSKPETTQEKVDMQQEVRTMASTTLEKLYSVQPKAKAAVEGSAGYAVFSNFGMKILVAGGGSGEGLAVETASKKETFMRMAELQVGLGMGVKKFSLVWVFDTKEAFDNFVNKGWEFGAQASAAAKAGDQGGALQGALSVAPGVWLYQLTDAGLALELTAKGTKYYKDSGLE